MASESLKRIPFSPATESEVSVLGGTMLAIAIIHFILGGLALLCCPCTACSVARGVSSAGLGVTHFLQQSFGQVSFTVIGILSFAQGFFLIGARNALNLVISTDQDDQKYLVDGLNKLKFFFFSPCLLFSISCRWRM